MRLEAESRAKEATVARGEQTGPHQQEERQRELRARQDSSAPRFATRSPTARPTTEQGSERTASHRSAKRRHDAEYEGRENGDTACDGDGPSVERKLVRARQVEWC